MTVPFLGGFATTAAGASTSHADANALDVVMKAPSIVAKSTLIGKVASNTTIEGAVGLKPRNEAALTQFIAGVTTKGSSTFHHYLAAGQFQSKFGPTAATVDSVKTALKNDGLTVSKVSSNGLLVDFSGTAAHVDSAFHTSLAEYKLPDGTTGRATSTAVKLPESIASKVDVVAGLDNLVKAQPAGIIRATEAEAKDHPAAKASTVPHVSGAPSACSDAQGTAAEYGGLTDDEIANAYGAFGLYGQGDTGQGESIAVYELEPFSPSDVQTFDTCYFGSSEASAMQNRLNVVPVDGGQPTGSGSGEAILDTEDVSAMAPGANIDVYEAPNNTYGGLDEYNTIVSDDTDQVVTSSWGLCETAVQQGEPGVQQEENAIFQQAAAQGQTVLAAEGDTGDDSCNEYRTPQPVAPVLSVLDPASQPYVVSVGGTTITDATQPPAEQVWNDGAEWGAGGGGISNTWVMPSWQQSSQVPGIDPLSTVSAAESVEGDDFCQGNADGSTYGGSQGEPCRETPDVSAQADEFTGAVTIYMGADGGWFTIGGTSSATPIWAAMLTLANASPACVDDTIDFGSPSTAVQDAGFASPILYAIASDPSAYAASFDDITVGNNDIYGQDGGAVFPATTGYDMASGLGTPQMTTPNGGDGLAYYLCSYGESTSRPAVTSLSPTEISTTSSGGSLQINGASFEMGSTPDVSSVWINNYEVPSGDITVNSATQLTVSDLPSGTQLNPTDSQTDGAGPAQVAVTISDGETSALTSASTLEVVDEVSSNPVPAVTGISTYGGPETGGNPNPVTIFGSGFDDTVSSVTFGGVSVPSDDYTVDSPYEITVAPGGVPDYSSGTTDCETDLSAANDICQVEVQVTNSNGSSHEYTILPTYEGALTFNNNAVMPAPAGCGCEVTPAPSEYDYFPAPQITSISTSGGPGDYASEEGTSLVTINGTGLNDFGLAYVYFGSPSYDNWDYNTSYISGTEIQIVANEQDLTVNAQNVPVSIVGLGGTSNSMNATYSGVPLTSSISIPYAPDSGGTSLQITGNGMNDTYFALFDDLYTPFSAGTQYDISKTSNREVTVTTPEQNPAIVGVSMCTTTGCSTPGENEEMVIYPPGNPSVSSSSPSSGPAHGGTLVTITGQNLGCATAVYFGKTLAESFTNAEALLDCGSSNAIEVLTPPGKPGTKDSITVDTIESEVTGYGATHKVAAATFTYTKSTPSAPTVSTKEGSDSITESWTPPATDGGSAVTYYVIRAIARGYATRTERVSASTRSYEFKNLFWGTTWKITATAHNASGAGLTGSTTASPKKP